MLNDLFRTYKKIIIAVVLLLSAILFWFFGCHRIRSGKREVTRWKQAEEGIQSYDFHTEHIFGTITFGTGGRLSADRSQPVVMNISSMDDSFTGTVKITLPGEEGKGIAYQSAVKCIKGYPSRVTLSIPRLGNVSFFSVEILDQYGTEELAEMIIGASDIGVSADAGSLSEKKTVYIGYLSDEPEKLEWLNELEFVKGQTNIVISLYKIREKDLWSGTQGLQSLSGILIDDYNTSRLSSRQVNCLREWVEKEGGSLLIGTGAHAKGVLAGLKNLTGMTPGESQEESLQFNYEDESSGYVTVETNSLKMSEGRPFRSENISYPASCYRTLTGKGRLLTLTWSLTDDALLQWTGRENMSRELFECFIPEDLRDYYSDEDSSWDLRRALYSFLKSQSPNIFNYAMFFIAYLSALGFFSYYMLRKMKKREYVWVVVPLISLLFSIGLYIRMRGLGDNAMSSYSALEIIDSKDVQQNIYFLYQNNEGDGSSIDLVPEITHVELMDYSYRTGDEDVASLRRLKQDYTINNTKKGYDIVFEKTVPGTAQLMQMVKEDGQEAGSPCFKADLQGNMSTFSGTVTNCSDWHFSRVILTRGCQYKVLYDLKPGEQVSVDAKDIRCWSGFEQENTAYGQDEGQGSLSSLVNYVLSGCTSDHEDFNTVLIAGITSDKNIKVLTDQDKLQNQETIFFDRFSLPADQDLYYISDINRECLTGDSTESSLARDTLEEKKTKAVYQFAMDKTVWLAARNRDTFSGSIYAYNYRTGKDDIIFSHQEDTMNARDLEPYISDTHRMTLTYKLKDDSDFGPAPLLTFVLKEESGSQ